MLSQSATSLHWINANHQIADCLTKLKGRADLLYTLLSENTLRIRYTTESGRKEIQRLNAGGATEDDEK
jgi:hypothetical protein